MRQKKQGNDSHHFVNCVHGSFTPQERKKKLGRALKDVARELQSAVFGLHLVDNKSRK